jgi:DNA-binding CsgD family transcriptional regulator/predicted ATPase
LRYGTHLARPAGRATVDATDRLPRVMTSSSTPLVGRAAELELMADALSTMDNSGLAIVVVAGDLGIGKTRLLDELARRALAADLSVLRAQATEIAQHVQFSILTDAMRPLLDRLGPDGPDAAARPADRFRMHTFVRRTLDGIRGPGTALLLDDLHWADPASLEQIEYLVHRPPRVPMLLGLAFRNGRPPAGLINAIARHDSVATWIRPGPLTLRDLRVLLPDASEERRHRILQASGGNPFFVRVLAGFTDRTLTALTGSERVELHKATGSERDILAGLAGEIAALDEPAQHVAYAAAVLGERAAVDLVSSATGLPIATVLDIVGQLRRCGLLTFDGGVLRFWHPLVRVAANELADADWRAALRTRASAVAHSHAQRTAQGQLHRRADRPEGRPAPVPESFASTTESMLTAREVEIAMLVAEGLSNREIAARLYLSHRTVEAHLSRMYTKLAVRSRTELIRSLINGRPRDGDPLMSR